HFHQHPAFDRSAGLSLFSRRWVAGRMVVFPRDALASRDTWRVPGSITRFSVVCSDAHTTRKDSAGVPVVGQAPRAPRGPISLFGTTLMRPPWRCATEARSWLAARALPDRPPALW